MSDDRDFTYIRCICVRSGRHHHREKQGRRCRPWGPLLKFQCGNTAGRWGEPGCNYGAYSVWGVVGAILGLVPLDTASATRLLYSLTLLHRIEREQNKDTGAPSLPVTKCQAPPHPSVRSDPAFARLASGAAPPHLPWVNCVLACKDAWCWLRQTSSS